MPHFEDSKVFSVGLNAGGSWVWAKFVGGYFWHKQSNKTPDITHQTLFVSGGSGVFRRKYWDELDGLDELFNPFYEEDVDIGYRSTKRGYINLWEPKAKVEHYKEPGVIASNFSKAYVAKIAQRNQLFFIWKNITDREKIIQHIMALIFKLILHPKYWVVFLSAVRSIFKVIKKRMVETKYAQISDRQILSKFLSDQI